MFSFSYTPQHPAARRHRREERGQRLCRARFPPPKFGENAPLPDYFVDAQTLSPDDHLVMQAAVQKYIDSSISKTINVPVSISFDAFKDVYLPCLCHGLQGLHHLSPQRCHRIGARCLEAVRSQAPETNESEPSAAARLAAADARSGRHRLHDQAAGPARRRLPGQHLQDQTGRTAITHATSPSTTS